MGDGLNVGLVFLAGVVSFVSPCVLPIVPAYLSVISGLSFEELQQAESVRQARGRLFASALAFILGFSVVTVGLMGGIVEIIGRLGPAWQRGIQIGGGLVVLVFALHLIGVFRITALFQERRFHVNGRKFGVAGAALVGAAFALGWSPCIGPILGGVIAMAAGTAKVGLLVAYTLGLAVPFLLAAVFVNLFLHSMGKVTRHLRKVEIASGILLLVMGGLLITGNLSTISEHAAFLTDWSNKLEGWQQ